MTLVLFDEMGGMVPASTKPQFDHHCIDQQVGRDREVKTSWWNIFCCCNKTFIGSTRESINKFKISISLLKKMQCWDQIGQHRKIQSIVTLKLHEVINSLWTLFFFNVSRSPSFLFVIESFIQTENDMTLLFFRWGWWNGASGKERKKVVF